MSQNGSKYCNKTTVVLFIYLYMLLFRLLFYRADMGWEI